MPGVIIVVVSDQEWQPPASRPPVVPACQPRVLVWSIWRDGRRHNCVLVGHGEYGWQVRIYPGSSGYTGHMVQTRAEAEAEAEDAKQECLAEGGTLMA